MISLMKTWRKPNSYWRMLIRLVALLPLAAVMAGCGGGNSDAAFNKNWIATWYAAPQYYSGDPIISNPTKSFSNQTYRQLMYISQGGSSVRVRISNVFGTSPLFLSAMHIAKSAGGSSIVASTDTVITFNGQLSVIVPVGQELYSDSVDLAVAPLSTLAVSTYVSTASTIETYHSLGLQTNYVATGNVVSASNIESTETNDFYAWISGIDVNNESIKKVVVAYGDSITDGYNSTLNQNNRFPNVLSRLFINAGIDAGVVNAGISGNRWIYDGIGPNGAGRFSRDVLNISGASHIIALLGINDIGTPSALGRANEGVTSEQIIAAITNAASAAHAKRLKFYSGTLMPFEGTFIPGYYTLSGENTRQAVNDFIRTTNVIDGFIDFDAVVRDPANNKALLPAYDSGDHLHPNDAGYAAIAAAVANLLR